MSRVFSSQSKSLLSELSDRCRFQRKGIHFSNFEVVSRNDIDDTEQIERHEKIFSRTADTIRRVFPEAHVLHDSVMRLILSPSFSRFIGKYNIVDELEKD